MFWCIIGLCCSHFWSCQWAALTVAGVATNIRHLSRPSQASRPAGCHIASPHAAVSHLLAPLIVPLPLVPLVRLIVTAGCVNGLPLQCQSCHQHLSLVTPLPGLSSGWLSRCLFSRRRLPTVLRQSLIGLRAAMSLALPARWCYQSSRDWYHQTI
jgi:hypothetical protein